MSVPNNYSFSLNDVRLELGLGSTASLTDCFAAACAAGFNPLYEGSKNSLRNFRDYNDSACGLSLTITPASYSAPVGGGSNVHTVVAVGSGWQYFSGLPSWCSLSATSGSAGSVGITLTVSANGTGSNRSATINFRLTADNSITDQISVFQFG